MKKIILLFLLISYTGVYGQKINKTEGQLLKTIDKNYKETLGLLEETVNINLMPLS